MGTPSILAQTRLFAQELWQYIVTIDSHFDDCLG
jgi:hypothetical protein